MSAWSSASRFSKLIREEEDGGVDADANSRSTLPAIGLFLLVNVSGANLVVPSFRPSHQDALCTRLWPVSYYIITIIKEALHCTFWHF